MMNKFYLNIDAGIDWYNDKIAITGSGIEKVNRDKLGMYVFGSFSKKELNATKMSLWQNRKQIPTLEQWFLILEFLMTNTKKIDSCTTEKTIREILICYYD